MRNLSRQTTIFNFVFCICITLSLISFISLIFPTLIIDSTIEIPRYNIDFFQTGYWSLSLIITNLIFISLLILYKLGKIPSSVIKIITTITKKDISPKLTIMILLVMFSIYVIFSIDELQREEFELGDYYLVKRNFETTNFGEFLWNSGNFSIDTTVRYTLLQISFILFDNVRIIPFIASISLLIVTYFLTVELTKTRISGIIALVVLMQSNLFLIFDTTATYENFWTIFYFLSLYLIFKKPIGSHASFILSILSKPLAITFLPINIFVIARKESTRFNKKILIFSYSIIIGLIVFAYVFNMIPSAQNLVFDNQKFIIGFNELSNALRFDGIIILLFFPMLMILWIKRNVLTKNIEIILIGISIMLLSQPLLYYVTDITIMPYRFIPLLIFISMGIGMIFSNSKNASL